MKKYSQSYFFLLLFNLIFILVDLCCANIIEKDIIIEGKNPFVKMKIGNQQDKKLLISFSSPSIITFPKVKDSSFVARNKSIKYKFKSNDLNLKMKKGNFTLNNKITNISINFSSIDETSTLIKEMNGLDGILGLYQKELDIFNKETFLGQLIAKNYISNKIIYISPYYNSTGGLNNNSKIKIGEFPKEFNKEDMHAIPLIENKDSLGYDCNISDLSIEDKFNKTKDNKTYIARIEEGQLEPISIPKSLLPLFKEHFSRRNCTIGNDKVNCPNLTVINNTNIKFKINGLEFQLGSILKDGKLNLKFIDDNIIVLTSEFTGNYHRIYDGKENKIFFSDFRGYSEKKKNNDVLIIVLIAGGALLLISIIVISIVVCVQRAKGKNLSKKVTSISFTADKNEEDDEESLLY
jgi:hypothetical protein